MAPRSSTLAPGHPLPPPSSSFGLVARFMLILTLSADHPRPNQPHLLPRPPIFSFRTPPDLGAVAARLRSSAGAPILRPSPPHFSLPGASLFGSQPLLPCLACWAGPPPDASCLAAKAGLSCTVTLRLALPMYPTAPSTPSLSSPAHSAKLAVTPRLLASDA
ncbi:hypothetical protein NL676_008832 [Syzygium grande]|nr:hypothetical protein NL676_008832 [Syzygium grande]